MKISKIDGSIYGAVFTGRPSLSLHVVNRTGRRHACSTLIFNESFTVGHATPSTQSRQIHTHRNPYSTHFPKYLTTAVARPGGRLPSLSYFTSQPPNDRNWNHTAVSTASSADPDARLKPRVFQPKHELLELVGQYDDESVEDHLESARDPYMRRYAPPNGPEPTVSDKREDITLQSINSRQHENEHDREALRNLRAAVLKKLRRPDHMDLDKVWELYLIIREPRVARLTARLRHQLLHALAQTKRKDEKSMLRYFAAVADVRNSGFALTSSEWNTALSFASRYVSVTTVAETEAALQLWRQMEHTAGVKADEVTFNIIFDSASKAGNFDLAEMVYEEMTARGFAYNRYHHVSLIHFFGLKQDAGGVRAAYREMIEDGEIVDTVTMNAVLSGFIRSGEEDAALRVYEKMKAHNEDLKVVPHRDYTHQKSVTKVLMMFAKVSKQHPDMRPSFQKAALLSPDLHTFRILVNHFGIRLGDLEKVAQFLDEMKPLSVPLHGAIFLGLFKSFSIHGGPDSDWSQPRLESVWGAFLDALDDGTDGIYISTWLASAILDAFATYSSREHMLDIYECLRSRWSLDANDSQYMLNYLNSLLQDLGNKTKSKRNLALQPWKL
ncbi:hypothetical protein F5Y15DRAFT_180000 [Xylariaceae sp. FL0016]|nr:hypothetical protein F5Y15DRAFT_180000 [Xylariaceae sp. FL0016]